MNYVKNISKQKVTLERRSLHIKENKSVSQERIQNRCFSWCKQKTGKTGNRY